MNIKEKVIKMYNQVPYPDYGDNPLEETYVKKKKYIDQVLGFNGNGYSVYADKKVLEAGCGTGRESIYMAFMGADLTSIDVTHKSLSVAKEQSDKFNFKYKIKFNMASVLELPFENNYFDIVLSSGVIHHTENPQKAFAELTRVLKPNGFLVLYVYNNYAHFIPNFRRKIVNIFAKDDIDKRVEIALKLFPLYLRKKNIAAVYDEFGHPHKSEHGIREVLKWFVDYGIVFDSVYPKFGFGGFFKTIKYQREYIKSGIFIPVDSSYSKPMILNVISSNLLQFFRGYFSYSGGYRYVGIKK